MSSSAVSAQQSVVRVRTATGTAVPFTAVTQANPAVVTSSGHPYADGTIIYIEDAGTMVELEGRAFVTTGSATNAFTLKGVNATGYTAFTGTGTARAQTMTAIGNAKNFDIKPDDANEIDVTNLASIAKEFRLGLKGSWSMTCDYDVDTSDAGQAELEAARSAGALRAFTVTLQNGKVFAGMGYVKSASAAGSPDGVVSGQFAVRGSGDPTWFV